MRKAGFRIRTTEGDSGPFTPSELRSLVASGQLTPNDLVQPQGKSRWYKADAVDGLFDNERLSLEPEVPQTRQNPYAVAVAKPKKNSPRLLVILLLIITPFFGAFIPAVSFWAAGLLGLVLLLFMIPVLRPGLRPLLRITPERPVSGGFKIASLWLYVGFLVLLGYSAVAAQEFVKEYEAQRAIEEAEERRLVAEAAAQVGVLYAEAITMLDNRDIEGAKAKLEEAQNVRFAKNDGRVHSLVSGIEKCADADSIFNELLWMEDSAFAEFQVGTIPPSFSFGHPTLNERAVVLARPRIEAAAAERMKREQLRIAAAEEQRKRAEKEAERLRQIAAEKAALEEARRAAAQQEIHDNLDAYKALLELGEVTLIDRLSVNRTGDTWELTLTVDNLWHVRHKQIRLQDAQTLWEWWARISSPQDPDKARLTLEDARGNRVGGSGWLGGSMISVKD